MTLALESLTLNEQSLIIVIQKEDATFDFLKSFADLKFIIECYVSTLEIKVEPSILNDIAIFQFSKISIFMKCQYVEEK